MTQRHIALIKQRAAQCLGLLDTEASKLLQLVRLEDCSLSETHLVGDAGLAVRDEGRVPNDQAADLQPALAQDSQVAVPHILTACRSAT